MINKKKILQASLAVGSVVMATGSGALLKIAPPDESIFSGIISLFILAAIGMIVNALSKNLLSKKKMANFVWTVVAVISILIFITVAVNYYKTHLKYVVRYEDNGYILYFIKGDVLRDERKHLDNNTASELIAAFHKPELIWTKESIAIAKQKLMWRYIVMIVSIGIMLFSALELCLISDQKQKT
jgi:ABC-type multidrug transport system fused ATPase/permease subunit